MNVPATISEFQESDRALADERRRGIRVRQDRPIKLFHAAAGRFVPGRTLDVSATGLRVELPRWAPLTDGTVLSVHVGLSRQGSMLANRRQMLPARVVWVRRTIGGDDPATAGLEFVSTLTARRDAA